MRRDLGLNVLDAIWAGQEMGEDEARDLARVATAVTRTSEHGREHRQPDAVAHRHRAV